MDALSLDEKTDLTLKHTKYMRDQQDRMMMIIVDLRKSVIGVREDLISVRSDITRLERGLAGVEVDVDRVKKALDMVSILPAGGA